MREFYIFSILSKFSETLSSSLLIQYKILIVAVFSLLFLERFSIRHAAGTTKIFSFFNCEGDCSGAGFTSYSIEKDSDINFLISSAIKKSLFINTTKKFSVYSYKGMILSAMPLPTSFPIRL
ncbi:MAG: hypothetical protein SPK17_00125 [Treponema sp.]|nr:hypothetical protein [Treponema sp.]